MSIGGWFMRGCPIEVPQEDWERLLEDARVAGYLEGYEDGLADREPQ